MGRGCIGKTNLASQNKFIFKMWPSHFSLSNSPGPEYEVEIVSTDFFNELSGGPDQFHRRVTTENVPINLSFILIV